MKIISLLCIILSSSALLSCQNSTISKREKEEIAEIANDISDTNDLKIQSRIEELEIRIRRIEGRKKCK